MNSSLSPEWRERTINFRGIVNTVIVITKEEAIIRERKKKKRKKERKEERKKERKKERKEERTKEREKERRKEREKEWETSLIMDNDAAILLPYDSLHEQR